MPFNIAIIDYGMGNLKSIYKLFRHLEIDCEITSKPDIIKNSDGVVLPGVGAFGDAMKNLRDRNLDVLIKNIVNEGKPLLGVCLGLQLLLSKSNEMGEHLGLDIIKGKVIMFDKSKGDKVPQIGWNNVNFEDPTHFLVKDIPNHAYFYFVHSFYAVAEDQSTILGTTRYGDIEFASILQKKNVIATQFHPEKSSKYGIQLYRNFIAYCMK